MRYILVGAACLCILLPGEASHAWDGFDADNSELVEIIPGVLPDKGDNVEVFYHESDTRVPCIVERLNHNSRTIEVIVRDPAGSLRTLVMDWTAP